MSDTREAAISIGGVALTYAESLAVRVGLDMAIAHFSEPNSVGRDEQGQRMRDNYLRLLSRVQTLVHASARGPHGLPEPIALR